MSGPAESKKEIKAKVYIHEKDEKTNSKVTHIDIESDELARIIKPKQKTFVGGKEGGVFIGLKKDMIKRAEDIVTESQPIKTVHVFFSGRVQKVMFRRFTKANANNLGLKGWVKNLPDKRVEAVIHGPANKVNKLLDILKKGYVVAKVNKMDSEDIESEEKFTKFEIRK